MVCANCLSSTTIIIKHVLLTTLSFVCTSQADALKAEGNQAFAAGDHETAIAKFTQAIELTPDNHVLYRCVRVCVFVWVMSSYTLTRG